jgi:glycosyltransferase involved in cell wall biosynthesis
MTIDACRNAAVKTALDANFDYVMFIDDDVLVPFDAWARLKSHDKHIVAGWTVIRGYPYLNMFFRFKDGGLKNYNDLPIDTKELTKVDAIGCSCVLIKCDVFKQIPPPYFVTGTHNTEDIYFCMKARDYVKDLEIYVDPLVKTPHMLAMEAVTPENRAFRKAFDEQQYPELAEEKHADRGAEYLVRIGE